MRKELLIASIIGIGFGLVIAFGAYRINSSLKPNNPQTKATPKSKVNVSEFKITPDKPQNNDVVTLDSTRVSGITKPLSWITVSGVDEDYTIQADDKGIFEQDVNLVAGINQIKITAFDSLGAQSTEKVLIVYSSSFQEKEVASASANIDSSTDSAIRARVQEKVIQALNKPKAYIGVVTDIADSTIQIKTTESQIEQISIKDDGITVVKTGTTNKTVKLTDIAIGDFIVGMGYVNSNSVLTAQRILITDPLTEPKVESIYGKVSIVTKKGLTVNPFKTEDQNTVTPDTKTMILSLQDQKVIKIKLADISENDLVIYVTDNTSDTPSVRAIFVIQS